MEANEYYLAKWLDNRMSDEALIAKEGASALEQYQKIKEVSTTLRLEIPASLDWEHFSKTLPQKSAPRVIRLRRIYAVAAVFLVLIGLSGLSGFFFSDIRWQATDAIANVVLPDGSTAVLAPGASLSYNRLYGWFERNLSMEGEVSFEVQKGSTFRVQSPQGEVEVLGTSFRVLDGADFYQVLCTEGKVRVRHQKMDFLLTPGLQYDSVSEKVAPFDLTSFGVENQLYYNRVPLNYLVKLIAHSYQLKIDLKSTKKHYFTGIIPLKNKEEALRAITLPFSLEVEETSNGYWTLREK